MRIEPVESRSFEHGSGVAMVLLAAVFVALMPNAAKVAYQSGANPIAVLTFRCVLGMMGLGLFMIATGRSFKLDPSDLKCSILTGASQALGSLGLMGAVAYIDVSLAFLIVFFHPFLIAVVEHYRGNTRLSLSNAGLIILAFAGLAMTVSVNLENMNLFGIGLAVLGAFAATAMVITVSGAARKTGVVSANFYMTAWAALFFVIAAWAGPSLGLLESMVLPSTNVGWTGLVGTGATFALGYLLFFAGAAAIGTTRASVLSIIEPVLAIFFAIYLFNEWLTSTQWLGVILVVGSLAAMEVRRSE